MNREFDVHSDAWKALSEDERFKIVEAVAARFVQEFGNLAEINWISPGPDGVWVGTALPEGTLMPSLPASFDGIPVEQEPLRESMDAYIATWSAILGRIGGWSADRIAAWANDRNPCFRSCWFLHDTPIESAAYALVPESLRKIGRIREMAIRIESEIDAGASGVACRVHPDLFPEYDWDAARERVHAAIRELEQSHVKS